MKSLKLSVLTLAVLGALGLPACNSSSTQDNAAPSSASIKKTSGVITGFGSVFVNGVEYETTNTSVSVEGASSSEDQLAVGMVVTLDGSVNSDGTTGTASHIDFSDELQGIVLGNTIAIDGKLNVMGQTVIVDGATIFESKITGILTPADIAQGNIVEVSGFSSGDGVIYATRIEVKASTHNTGEEVELKGVVSSVTATTFMMGQLTVDYSGTQLEDLPNGAVSDGLYVEVKSVDGFDANNNLIASKVELKGDGKKGIEGQEGEEMELEGVVTEVTSSTEFQINGQNVLINDETEFSQGSAADIVVGLKLEVKISVDADGKLVAKKIEFRKSAEIKMDVYVDSIDMDNNTLTVFGQTISVNNLTAMKDEREGGGFTPVRYFSLKDLAAMDRIEIQAYVDDSGKLIATKLRRNDDEGKAVELGGKAEGPLANGILVVAGVTVQVDPITFPNFVAASGDKVEVRGSYANGILVASEISIDD